MFPSVYLVLWLGQLPGQPPPVAPVPLLINVRFKQGALELEWHDTENRLQGTIAPARPQAGKPFDVALSVGEFAGADFEGPVTVTFKEPLDPTVKEGETLGLRPLQQRAPDVSATLTRDKGARTWAHSFTLPSAGSWMVEVSFQTQRRKVLRGLFDVDEARLPTWPWYLVGALALVLAIGLGVRLMLRDEGQPKAT
jgi:hypothetical protein